MDLKTKEGVYITLDDLVFDFLKEDEPEGCHLVSMVAFNKYRAYRVRVFDKFKGSLEKRYEEVEKVLVDDELLRDFKEKARYEVPDIIRDYQKHYKQDYQDRIVEDFTRVVVNQATEIKKEIEEKTSIKSGLKVAVLATVIAPPVLLMMLALLSKSFDMLLGTDAFDSFIDAVVRFLQGLK